MDIPGRIEHLDDLERRFRSPSERAATKVFHRIDDASGRFIDACRIVIMATGDGRGSLDASPRGGPAGFLQRLDDRHIAIPDFVGNNRLDSFRNVLTHPHAGLLLLVPGKEETLRINGPAALTVDPGILSGFTSAVRLPKLAIVVETDELYGHCAKALRRAEVWDASRWDQSSDAPDLAEIYACQFDGIDTDDMRRTIHGLYAEELGND